LKENDSLTDTFNLKIVNGHTEGMMLPVINYNGQQIIYCADLIPSAGHLPVSYVMAYDTRPLITLEEKAIFMKEALKNKAILFFEHDLLNECCSIEETERGIRVKDKFSLSAL
jgi:hypothetical protein